MTAHEGRVIAQRSGFSVIECLTCSFAHLEPLPNSGELALMYEREYYQEMNPNWLQKDRLERSYWDLEHADKISDWRQILKRQTGSVLDVGCSGGLLLEYAVGQGWTGEGIEPSQNAVLEARTAGLTVQAGLYADVNIEAGRFDVVHAKLVMEHLCDPAAFLEWSHRALAPGGVLSVQVPNEFTPLQLGARDALCKEDWWVAPPFHINYFTFGSLERLLSANGFEVVSRNATFPMEWFLLMGDDYVGSEEVGLRCHQKRMRFEIALERLDLRRSLHAYLAEQGLGREAIVHGRKIGP